MKLKKLLGIAPRRSALVEFDTGTSIIASQGDDFQLTESFPVETAPPGRGRVARKLQDEIQTNQIP